MNRVIFASNDVSEKMKLFKKKRVDVYSFFPIDRGDCECASLISEWKDKLKMMKPEDREGALEKVGSLLCPRDKTGMQRYRITCKNCGEIQGYCYATDPSLIDFCDFHYTSWTNGKEWKGCFTPNISPITQMLTLECTCGQDTRDFRANQTLPVRVIDNLEKEAKKGREFGKTSSAFRVLLA